MLTSDLDEEIAFHLGARTAELEREGLGPAEAKRQAAAEFGDVAGTLAYCLEQDRAAERQLRWSDRLYDLGREFRLVARRLARQPLLLATGSGTLALGIGAAIALWTVVNQVVVNPFQFRDSERLVTLWHEVRESQVRITPQMKAADLWRRNARSIEGFESIGAGDGVLQEGSGAERVAIRRLSHTFLDFTGLRPWLGRTILPGDREPGAPRVAWLGHAWWRQRYGGDRGVIGRSVILDNERVEIVGVLPRELDYLPGSYRGGATRYVVPLPVHPQAEENSFVVGRLRPGVTLAAATAELRSLDASLAERDAAFKRFQTRVDAARDLLGSRNIRTLYILLGAVGVLLCIACANVAHLLLGRMLARRAERAVRSALGASRGNLMFAGLLEASVIGLLGGVVGLLLSFPLLRLMVTHRPPNLDMLEAVRPAPSAALVAVGLGVLVTMLAGLFPSWRSSRTAPAELLGGTWTAGRPEGRRLRAILLTTEVALSLLLLVGAGLITRSLWRLGQLDIGFEATGVIAADLDLPPWRFQTTASGRAFLSQVTEAVRGLPGVVSATRASGVPPETGITFGTLEIDGRALGENEKESFFAWQSVEPDYFATMGIPLREGRTFEPRDAGDISVYVVSEALARRYWPPGQAVGKRIRIGAEARWSEIIGVVGNVPALGLGEMRGALHIYGTAGNREYVSTIVARTTLSPGAYERALREVITRIDPSVPIQRIATVPGMLRASTATERFTGVLLTGFAVFATILFAAGLFGVLSHAVSQRTREIGVRVAIGADPRRVRWLVVRQGLNAVLAGVVLGLVAAWMSAKTVATLLFDISPRDLVTFVAAAGVTIAVALAASYLPARRATRLDPTSALRSE
jgi:predicted permease